MSVFQSSKEGIKDTGFNILTVPYLGPAKFNKAEVAKIGSVDDCFVVSFDLLGTDIRDNDVSSLNHQHVEWAPNDQNDEDSIQAKVDRIAYIASTVVPDEKVVSVQATDWVDYCKAIIELMETYDYKSKEVEIKVIGNVYKGKTKVNFPGYRNFITTPDSKPLTFSASEQKKNEEYMKAVGSTPSSTNEDGVDIGDVDEAEF